jgi:xylulose-5-phosphate/fructose-6-phosphate phosphoketolase
MNAPRLSPDMLHRIGAYRRAANYHKEEGTITAAFDMRVQNDLDRFHLIQEVIDRVSEFGAPGAYLKPLMADKLIAHKQYIDQHGEDMPAIRNSKWVGG